MDDFARIRHLHHGGQSARQIAKQLGVGRDTIRKALAHAEPLPYTRTVPRPAPVFGPFAPIVDAILEQDRTAPPKQRHTASQVFRRLVAEHAYTGGYDQVRRHLQSRRRAARDTFVPLDHPPGHRCEADFGHIHVEFPDGCRPVPVLVVTWSYSNAPFAVALPTERTEAVLHGMCEAFGFFGCVPAEVWWDNPTTVATRVHPGRDRTVHPRYAALASHFLFAPKFCLPRTPREKPRVENRVKDLERMWATPVPQVPDPAALNAHLRRCCVAARERTCGGNAETVAVRFERDRAAARPLPRHPFDPCVIEPGTADKYQTVGFDGNRYSVPRAWAFRGVTVKGFIDRVEVVAGHRVVASHARCYARRERVLDPLHFLATLRDRPATLDHAPVYRDWDLPPVFAQLRTRFEAGHGVRAGGRQHILVLQLLARFPLAVVEAAVVAHLSRTRPTAAAVTASAERLAAAAPPPTDTVPSPIPVPRPDLSRFDRLLPRSPEGASDARPERDAFERQPEAAEVADDVGRVRPTGP